MIEKEEVDIVLIEDNSDDIGGGEALNYFFKSNQIKIKKLVLLDFKFLKINGTEYV